MNTHRFVNTSTREPVDADPFAPDPGHLVDIEHPGAALSREQVGSRVQRGVWRFRELVDPGMAVGEEVSLAEGDTPLLASAASPHLSAPASPRLS